MSSPPFRSAPSPHASLPRLRPRALAAALGVLAALAAPTLPPHAAWAQAAPAATPSVEEQAEQKFREGRAAQDKGLFREALQLFEESVRLKSSPATLLNLGNCHVQLGELMKAMAAFQSAHEDAQRWPGSTELRDLWEREARGHIEDLSQRIPELTLRPSATPGARVQINGNPIERLGAPLQLDPGRYQLQVMADGKRTFTQEFLLSLGQKMEVALPSLEDAAVVLPPMPPPPVTEGPPEAGRGASVLPWALMGGGAALAVSSLIPGLMAQSKASELKDACKTQHDCDPALKGKRDSAATLSLVSDVLWITGALTAGVGITLFVLEQPSEGDSATAERALNLRAGCFDSGCGLSAQGQF